MFYRFKRFIFNAFKFSKCICDTRETCIYSNVEKQCIVWIIIHLKMIAQGLGIKYLELCAFVLVLLSGACLALQFCGISVQVLIFLMILVLRFIYRLVNQVVHVLFVLFSRLLVERCNNFSGVITSVYAACVGYGGSLVEYACRKRRKLVFPLNKNIFQLEETLQEKCKVNFIAHVTTHDDHFYCNTLSEMCNPR